MESYQAEPTNATFQLSAEHLDALTQKQEQPTLWQRIRYGRAGPPAASTAAPAESEDALISDGRRSWWSMLRYGRAGRPAPPPPPPAPLAPLSAASGMVGMVAPTAAGRIRNVEAAELPGGHTLQVNDLSLLTPDGSRQLFANVSVGVRPGDHLLIMGNSGTGKSSMLRAFAGLWDRGEGEVWRPSVSETMFLPQRPYCTLGSLRQQLVYPRTVEEWQAEHTDAPLLSALRTVQLTRLAERGEAGLDAVRDWGDELSLGEQQRLAFARLLVNKPRLAILDEATSALDLNNEAAMYKALAKIPGITYLSVGHRPSLLRYHSSRLLLYGMEQNPSYAVEPIDDTTLMQQEQLESSLKL